MAPNASTQKQLNTELRRFYALNAISQFLIESSIWLFFLTEYRQFSLAEAVAYNAGITTVSGLLDLPTGSWADRFGRRRMVILGFASRALGAALMLYANSVPVLMLAAIAAGFGWAQMSGASQAFVHDNLKARGADSQFGQFLVNSTIINFTSRTLAFIVAGWLYALHPLSPYIVIVLALSFGAYITATITEQPYERTSAITDREQVWQGLKVFWQNKQLLRLSLIMLATAGLFEQIWFSFQPLLLSAGLGPKAVSYGYALGALGSVLGAQLVKRVFRPKHERYILAAAAMTCALGSALFASLKLPIFLIVAQFITCIGFGLRAGFEGTLLNRHLPSSHRAVCLSIYSTMEACLSGSLGIGLGYLYQNIDHYIPPTIIALTLLALAPALLKATKNSSPAQP